eukprot:scaffold244_cov172-Amphora_coffeaeformis.AAC.54
MRKLSHYDTISVPIVSLFSSENCEGAGGGRWENGSTTNTRWKRRKTGEKLDHRFFDKVNAP